MNKEDFIKSVKERLMDQGNLVFIVREKNYSGFPDLVVIKRGEVKFVYVKMESFMLARIQLMTAQLISRKGVGCYLLRNCEKKESLAQFTGEDQRPLKELPLENLFK